MRLYLPLGLSILSAQHHSPTSPFNHLNSMSIKTGQDTNSIGQLYLTICSSFTLYSQFHSLRLEPHCPVRYNMDKR